MKKLYIPLLALVIFLSESIFVTTFSGEFFTGDKIFVPRFLMIFLVFMAVYSGNRTALYYSFVIGILFDVVYTEILGIYLFIFPLITYGISKVMKILQNNIFVVSFMSLVAIAILEMIVYGMNALLGFVSMTFQQFLSDRLVPTLILNAIVILIIAYPLRKFLLKYSEEENNEILFRKKTK